MAMTKCRRARREFAARGSAFAKTSDPSAYLPSTHTQPTHKTPSMLDSIIDQVKSQAIGAITQQTGLSADQAEQAVPVAQESIKDGLMGAAMSGNFGGIQEMFQMVGGGGGGAAGGLGAMAKNAVFASILTKFVGGLTSKLGIGDCIADKVGAVALPMILGKLGGQVTSEGGGFDLGGITKLVGGGAAESATGALGGLADKAKGMLGGMLGG